MGKAVDKSQALFELLLENDPTTKIDRPPAIDLTSLSVGADRRGVERLSMTGEIHLQTPNAKSFSGQSVDLSASGIGVQVDKEHLFESGEILTIEFRPPSGLKGFVAQVEIVHVKKAEGGKRHLGLRIAKATKLMEQKLIEFITEAKQNPWR